MNLHHFDCLEQTNQLRGVEARVPFLDQDFLDHAMSVDPELKFL